VPRKKLFVSYSGLNEKEFFYDPSVAKRKKFAVLFRGRFLPESGILTVIKSAKLLENSEVDFLIIGHGFMYREVNALMKKLSPKNISMVHDRISIQELRNQMLSCHVSLGQVAIHKRLERTIPCKLFESIALKLPYITGENIGALEILSNNETCLTVEPGNEKDLADKILYLKNNPDKSLRIAEAGYKLYIEKLTSKELVRSTLTALGY
jgi:glycosyltransferase involved in cell wall biosynthesis